MSARNTGALCFKSRAKIFLLPANTLLRPSSILTCAVVRSERDVKGALHVHENFTL